MNYLKIPRGSYDRLLDRDPKLILMDICDFITYQRNRGGSSATVSTYVAGINKIFVVTDVTILNWKKIKGFMGEHEKFAEDRPYTHSEIAALLAHSSIRNRCMIFLIASAGLRIGALPILRIKDLEPNDEYNIFRISIYAKSKKSS
jgi:integrase